jgi:hypothetical protein
MSECRIWFVSDMDSIGHGHVSRDWDLGRVWLPAYAAARLYGCSYRAFGWLVGGWGLSHTVQDSLVSQAQLMRQKSSFLRGQARASAANMQTGHVSETADASMQCTKRNLRTARLCEYDNQTPAMCMRLAWLPVGWLLRYSLAHLRS